MDFTDSERLLLYNQYEILICLHNDDEYASVYKTYQEILINGYEHDYGMLTEYFKHTPREVSEFVWDVLQMYRTLDSSADKLGVRDQLHIEFRGFDGNDESDYYSYAKFVLDVLGRYGEFREDKNKSLNTHSPRVHKYQEMLQRWLSLGKDRYTNKLSLDEINYVLKGQ